MIIYNEEGIFTKHFHTKQLLFYSKKYRLGETAAFPSPVEELGDCPTVPILVNGSIALSNRAMSENPMVVTAGPGKIFNGDLLPGIYDMECLEDDTVYTCLAFYDYGLSPEANAMKTNWGRFLELVEIGGVMATTVTGDEVTDIIVCMVGSITITPSTGPEIILQESDSYNLSIDEIVIVSATDEGSAQFAYPV